MMERDLKTNALISNDRSELERHRQIKRQRQSLKKLQSDVKVLQEQINKINALLKADDN